MQSLTWYCRRLSAMSPAEILWRVRCLARDAVDRYTIRLRTRSAARRVRRSLDADEQSDFAVTDWPSRDALDSSWASRLRERADRIAAGRMRIFDLDDCDLGDPINWNRDPKSGVAAPNVFAPLIDYRDKTIAGDCKFVWEPNRHHQWVVLARAYHATGDESHARALVSQWESWLDQCPHGMGMNWRSALELGIRLINWTWAYDLVRSSEAMTPAIRERVLQSVYLHLWEIDRNYSQGSSAANHRVGEAAGVLVACSYFRQLPDVERWGARARGILHEAIGEQTFTDGGTREQALGYHVFVIQFFLIAGLAARRSGQDLPADYWERLHRMFAFLAAMSAGGDHLPLFGDADEGYVLDLDGDPQDAAPWLAIGAVLFGDSALKPPGGTSLEAGTWLLGDTFSNDFAQLPDGPASLESCSFADAGYYLLQSGHHDAADRISVVFDCGPLGFRSIAAHGHADALSFTLRAFGMDVLVDPGTYDYFTYPAWRRYFRDTCAHNTIEVDEVGQSEMQGLFLWGSRAEASCLEWQPANGGGCVHGEHDGYRRLDDPVTHRRRLELDGETRVLSVEDELVAEGKHDYAVFFHLGEGCRVARHDGTQVELETGRGTVVIELDERLDLEVIAGGDVGCEGWISRGYHHRTASTTLVGRCTHKGALRLRHRIVVGQPTDDHNRAAKPDRAKQTALVGERDVDQGGYDHA